MTGLFGNYRVRLARGADDLAQVFALRQARFSAGSDDFDAGARHIMVTDAAGDLLCCYRLMPLENGAAMRRSYSAQFYDLAGMAHFTQPVIELGRFCLAGGAAPPDVLRLAFAAMARVVDACGAGLLFGCSSFQGAGVAAHLPALAALRGHVAAAPWQVGKKSATGFDFGAFDFAGLNGNSDGLRGIPPLLRHYLALGGWVSDHAVPDADLDTLHVFTGVEIAKIPAARAAILREMAIKITL